MRKKNRFASTLIILGLIALLTGCNSRLGNNPTSNYPTLKDGIPPTEQGSYPTEIYDDGLVTFNGPDTVSAPIGQAVQVNFTITMKISGLTYHLELISRDGSPLPKGVDFTQSDLSNKSETYQLSWTPTQNDLNGQDTANYNLSIQLVVDQGSQSVLAGQTISKNLSLVAVGHGEKPVIELIPVLSAEEGKTQDFDIQVHELVSSSDQSSVPQIVPQKLSKGYFQKHPCTEDGSSLISISSDAPVISTGQNQLTTYTFHAILQAPTKAPRAKSKSCSQLESENNFTPYAFAIQAIDANNIPSDLKTVLANVTYSEPSPKPRISLKAEYAFPSGPVSAWNTESFKITLDQGTLEPLNLTKLNKQLQRRRGQTSPVVTCNPQQSDTEIDCQIVWAPGCQEHPTPFVAIISASAKGADGKTYTSTVRHTLLTDQHSDACQAQPGVTK